MKSSLLILAVVFVQQILALGAGADEPVAPEEASDVDVGGGEGGEAGWVPPSSRTPANAAAPSGGVM